MNYYRKPNKIIDDVKLKMQLGALTLKISKNNDKIDELIGVDKNIKKDISTNTSKITTNEGNISSNLLKLNNMDIDVKKDIYKKTVIIDNMETTSNFKPIFYKY